MNSDCCGCEVGFESGEGDDMIGICMACKEWCGVVQEDSEDEAMVKALEDNSMTMEEYNNLPDLTPGYFNGKRVGDGITMSEVESWGWMGNDYN